MVGQIAIWVKGPFNVLKALSSYFYPQSLILLFSHTDDSELWPWTDTHTQTHTHSHTSICLHLEWTNSHSLSHSFPLSPQSRLFLPLSSLLLFPFLWNLKISHPDCVLYILLPWWLPCRASKMSVCVCLRVCVCMYNVCLCASSSTISQAQILKLFSEETTIKGETPTIPFL